jgi:DNA repair exonuclease SbcCD ATPase subunit
MIDELRRQLREVEQALVALGEVIAVRREYVALLQRLGAYERELAALDALIKALSRLQSQRDDLVASLASRAR